MSGCVLKFFVLYFKQVRFLYSLTETFNIKAYLENKTDGIERKKISGTCTRSGNLGDEIENEGELELKK